MKRPLEHFQSSNYLLDKFHIRTIISGSIVKKFNCSSRSIAVHSMTHMLHSFSSFDIMSIQAIICLIKPPLNESWVNKFFICSIDHSTNHLIGQSFFFVSYHQGDATFSQLKTLSVMRCVLRPELKQAVIGTREQIRAISRVSELTV